MALKLATAKIGNHIFGTGDRTKKKLSGFHSKAKYSECSLKPQIHRTWTLGSKGFYFCGWNYYEGKTTHLKWSTMFPDSWGAEKVMVAIQAAVDHWNKPGDSKDLLNNLITKFKVSWVGNAKVDGYTYVLGGMVSGGDAISGFPLMGANANIPKRSEAVDGLQPNGDEDVEDDD